MRKSAPESFTQWQTSAELFAKADKPRRAMGWDRFVKDNSAKHLREAWLIGRVAILLSASCARLSESEPPDGYLEIKSKIIPVEVTECLQGGRRRGDEEHSEIRVRSEEELDAAIERNSEWLQSLIRKKLDRDYNYPPNTIVLVFLNTSLYNFYPARTRAELEAVAQLQAKNIVGSIILYEEEIYGRSSLARVEFNRK